MRRVCCNSSMASYIILLTDRVSASKKRFAGIFNTEGLDSIVLLSRPVISMLDVVVSNILLRNQLSWYSWLQKGKLLSHRAAPECHRQGDRPNRNFLTFLGVKNTFWVTILTFFLSHCILCAFTNLLTLTPSWLGASSLCFYQFNWELTWPCATPCRYITEHIYIVE